MFGFLATLEESAQVSASASLAAASQAQGILFQSQETDDLLSELSSVSSFSETDSTSGVAAENVQGRSLFGTMVATLNGSGVQTTNVGVTGTTQIGQVLVWGNLEISQNPSYTTLTVNQSPSYSTVTPSQSPSYSEITSSQSASYSEVTPSQTPSWDS